MLYALLLLLPSSVVFIVDGSSRLPKDPRKSRYSESGLYPTQSLESIVEEIEGYIYPPDDRQRKILQKKRPKWMTFPCLRDGPPMRRSPSRPKSVHNLRPGDIDVIGAMGDSITCGNAAREESALGFVIQDRGVSFTGGGIGTWHEVTTLPNLIKEYNVNLRGYSIGRGDFLSYNAQLNVAVPAAIDDDIMDQVKLFTKKMRVDKRIDFDNDWKLLSIFIGHNDVCSYECFDGRKHSAEAHKLNLQRALDYLYERVPRIFVNLISMLDPSLAARIPTKTFACDIFRRFACSCMYRDSGIKEAILRLTAVVRKYQRAEKELVLSGRYDGREDFTVEWQPFALAMNAPESAKEGEDARLMAVLESDSPFWSPECFHFNQRGLAEMAVLLWNNMLEPVGNKSTSMEGFMDNNFKCPTKNNPYFFTKKNTENFYKSGRQ